jgi:hypothetical protein
MHYIEILGVSATIILLISMSYSCKDRKSKIIMRLMNALAAVLFIIYSIVINAYSTILSNLAILLIDIFYLIKLYRSKE